MQAEPHPWWFGCSLVFTAWLPVGKITSTSYCLPPLTMQCATGGETLHSVLPVDICVIVFFTGSITFGCFFFKIYQEKSRNCLTGLADKCRSSQVFHSSWVWWKFWKCNLKRRNQKTRRGNTRTAIMLKEKGTARYFWMLRSCITIHRNLVSLFPYYQWYISCQKAHAEGAQ